MAGKHGKVAAPAMDHDYQAEDDHRTLTRAAEVHGDPARMKGVAKHHTKQTRSLAKVGKMLGGKR